MFPGWWNSSFQQDASLAWGFPILWESSKFGRLKAEAPSMVLRAACPAGKGSPVAPAVRKHARKCILGQMSFDLRFCYGFKPSWVIPLLGWVQLGQDPMIVKFEPHVTWFHVWRTSCCQSLNPLQYASPWPNIARRHTSVYPLRIYQYQAFWALLYQHRKRYKSNILLK